MSWYSDVDEYLISCSGCGAPECCSGCQDEPGWTSFTWQPPPLQKRTRNGKIWFKRRGIQTRWYCPKAKCKEREQHLRIQVAAEEVKKDQRFEAQG